MKKFTLSCLFFLFCPIVLAAPADNLSHLLSDFKTMTANFSQTVSTDNDEVLQKSSGNVVISRPGKFYWNRTQPIAQQIIVNDNQVWIIDPDLEQATLRDLAASAGDTPAMLLTGKIDNINVAYDVTELPSANNQQYFKLVSKAKDSVTAAIIIGFSNHKISFMKIYDQLGNVTILEFSAVTVNAPVNKKQFDFKPSKTIDVINER